MYYETQPPRQPAGEGCLASLGWPVYGLALPCASPTFYWRAVRRGAGQALLFFALFNLAIALVAAAAVQRAVAPVGRQIAQAFASGAVPEIVVTHGTVFVNGPQPFVLLDEAGTLLAVDTTGALQQIDTTRYRQGALLTRTELHLLSDTQYQRVPAQLLNAQFGADPLVLNAQTAGQMWEQASTLILVLGLVALVLWNVVVRLLYLLALGLVIWGIATLLRPTTAFSPVFATGIYAFVPAFYLTHILGRLGYDGFTGLGTLILVPIWAVALVAALAERKGGLLKGERTLRGWRALIGLPFVALAALDAVFPLPEGGLLLLALGLMTFSALATVGLLTAPRAVPAAAADGWSSGTGGS